MSELGRTVQAVEDNTREELDAGLPGRCRANLTHMPPCHDHRDRW